MHRDAFYVQYSKPAFWCMLSTQHDRDMTNWLQMCGKMEFCTFRSFSVDSVDLVPRVVLGVCPEWSTFGIASAMLRVSNSVWLWPCHMMLHGELLLQTKPPAPEDIINTPVNQDSHGKNPPCWWVLPGKMEKISMAMLVDRRVANLPFTNPTHRFCCWLFLYQSGWFMSRRLMLWTWHKLVQSKRSARESWWQKLPNHDP